MSKLNIVKKNKDIAFGSLEVGTVFTFDCKHYLKVKEIEGITGTHNALQLSTCEIVKFSYNTTVEVEEATLTIG